MQPVGLAVGISGSLLPRFRRETAEDPLQVQATHAHKLDMQNPVNLIRVLAAVAIALGRAHQGRVVEKPRKSGQFCSTSDSL